VVQVNFSGDGRRRASSSFDSTVRVWDLRTGKEELVLQHPSPWAVRGVDFSPDSPWIATACDNGRLGLWDGRDVRSVFSLPAHTGFVRRLSFSPDGRRLASASADYLNPSKPEEVIVWDLTTGQELLTLKGKTAGILCVAFSRDGQRLAAGGVDGVVHVWDGSPERPGP
jgi:WD40 repeat protein